MSVDISSTAVAIVDDNLADRRANGSSGATTPYSLFKENYKMAESIKVKRVKINGCVLNEITSSEVGVFNFVFCPRGFVSSAEMLLDRGALPACKADSCEHLPGVGDFIRGQWAVFIFN